MTPSPLPRRLAVILAAGTFAAFAAAAQAAPAPLTLEARIAGPDGGWDYATVDSAHHRLYVARTWGVMVLDTDTRKLTEHFAEGVRTHAVLPIPGTDILLTTNGGDNSARFLDAKTGALLASVPTGKSPDAAVYDPASGQVWVMNHAGGDVTVIDPVKRSVVATVAVGGTLEFAVVDGKGRLYVNVEDRNEIAVIDTKAGKVVAHYPLKGCDEPSGLALTDYGQLIASCGNDVAAVLHATDGKAAPNLAIGSGPDAVLYDSAHQRAYIPTSEDGKLWTLAVAKSGVRVLSSSPTQISGRTGAVDPRTGEVYIPAASYQPPAVATDRPTQTPGSFAVLVLKPTS
jgi:YVTN family beta-propeller protein